MPCPYLNIDLNGTSIICIICQNEHYLLNKTDFVIECRTLFSQEFVSSQLFQAFICFHQERDQSRFFENFDDDGNTIQRKFCLSFLIDAKVTKA
jgi:hypothetical protein